MSKLRRLSGRQCVEAPQKVGFMLKRQEGSHIILGRETPFCQLFLPDHKELERGTLCAIVRQSGLSVEEFVPLLD
jgi:predicted RNA binding protein YcfA (HicA-like mRNA interferase family)